MEGQDDANGAPELRRIVDSSRKTYAPKCIAFMQWLRGHCKAKEEQADTAEEREHWHTFVSERWKRHDGETDESLRQRTLRLLEEADQDNPPFVFERMSADIVILYLDAVRVVKNGVEALPARSTVEGHRAAICSIFRDFHFAPPAEYDSQLSMYFSGLKKERAKARKARKAGTKVKKAKDAIPLKAFRSLSLIMMKIWSDVAVIARLMMILSWNLMCRLSSSSSISHASMEWHEDALVIRFQHQQNDQEGNDAGHAQHVYANPSMPEVCPILALGMYWACYPSFEDRFLFPGTSQAPRFTNWLFGVFMQREDVRGVLLEHSLEARQLGSHSWRRGCKTYCLSGTTAPPSRASIEIRGGWERGRRDKADSKYDPVGDQHVGRTACGLQPNTHWFAVLPPFFCTAPEGLSESNASDGDHGMRDEPTQQRRAISDAIQCCFPGIPQRLQRIGEFCLASLIYHRDWLRQNLPSSHGLFCTPLFTTSICEKLAPLVQCRVGEPSDPICPSGVPPHVELHCKMERALVELRASREELAMLPGRVVEGVTAVLEERLIGANAVAGDGLLDLITGAINKVVSPEQSSLAPRMNHEPASPSETSVNAGKRDLPMHVWDCGFVSKLPEGFLLPSKSPLLTMWQLWLCGNENERILPLRHVQPSDFGASSCKVACAQRKRFSDLKFIMCELENECKRRGDWRDTFDIPQATSAFKAVAGIVHPLFSQDGEQEEPIALPTKRRRTQITWKTAVKMLRTHKKRQKVN